MASTSEGVPDVVVGEEEARDEDSFLPACESCGTELADRRDRVLRRGVWLCKSQCASTELWFNRRVRQENQVAGVERFRASDPQQYEYKLFDLISTISSRSEKRQTRGKWERLVACSVISEMARFRRVLSRMYHWFAL